MSVKNLTPPEIEEIRLIHSNTNLSWDQKMNHLMEKFDKSERTIRRWISTLGFAKKEEHCIITEQYEEAKNKTHDNKNYYLITWAQNDTPVHLEMIRNMEAYADYLDAEILVIAGRYRNPVSLKSSKNIESKEKQMEWSSDISKYLTANRHSIHQYLNILADVKVMPTAETPLSGFEGFSGLESSVLGHPKQHLKSLPILEGYPHKVLMSTGAVTKKNYTDTKAGKKGDFHHIYGFVVVEIRDSEVFHIRNVNVNDSGEFNDIIINVKDGEVSINKECEALVMGDLHVGKHDEDVIEETDILIDALKPENLILHDVFDGESISHHHERDPFKKYRKHMSGDDDLEVEIANTIEFIERYKDIENVHIVKSNHDTHVDRYLRERDWKKDIVNSEAYMELALAILKGDADNGIIPYRISKAIPEYNCLGLNDSLNINSVECAMHGDSGANGSRGSITQFKKLNVKTIVGHSHSPEIQGPAYTVGTSTELRLDYNNGLSSWMNAHVIIDDLGKRQMLMFADGKFTTLIDNIYGKDS